MNWSVMLVAASFIVAGTVMTGTVLATQDKRAAQMENERRKLDRTKDPEDRTESLMKIADIQLTYVTDAVGASDLSKMQTSLQEYRQTVSDARNTMMNSGLNPYKKSGGYRNVELGLRKHVRVLEETAKRLTLAQRPPVEETIRIISAIHDEFLQVLFK